MAMAFSLPKLSSQPVALLLFHPLPEPSAHGRSIFCDSMVKVLALPQVLARYSFRLALSIVAELGKQVDRTR
jgi:hypothetical protein